MCPGASTARIGQNPRISNWIRWPGRCTGNRMRFARSAVLLLTVTVTLRILAPRAASAATLEEVIALSSAGVSEAVLLALVERDQSVFALEVPQLVALKQAGVSE